MYHQSVNWGTKGRTYLSPMRHFEGLPFPPAAAQCGLSSLLPKSLTKSGSRTDLVAECALAARQSKSRLEAPRVCPTTPVLPPVAKLTPASELLRSTVPTVPVSPERRSESETNTQGSSFCGLRLFARLQEFSLQELTVRPRCGRKLYHCEPSILYAVRATERVPAGSCHFPCFTDPSQSVASSLCV